MAEYRLRRRAEADLEDVFAYTAEHFGFANARRLRDRLLEACRTLAKYPLIGSDCTQYRQGVRRFVVGVHVVYYRVEGNLVRVIRILGPGQDPARHLGATD